MTKLKLINPSIEYKNEVLIYRKEFIENKEILNGSGGLYKFDNFEEWKKHLLNSANKNTIKEGKVPESTFLAISTEDNKLIGMISIRHELNDYLLNFGGHIGYSVKKTERKKGYASEMLALALIESRNLNLDKVLITCKKSNIGSVKTICNNSGVFDNEVYEKDSNEIFQRYWIYL